MTVFIQRVGLFVLMAVLTAFGLNAALVRTVDPLLFFSSMGNARQPLFSTTEHGNFSRFAYTGLVRTLDFSTLWLGPSYATPFASTQDTEDELMISMGNMTGFEMPQIIAAATRDRAVPVVNAVISPLHFTPFYFRWAEHWVTFPNRFYGPYGTLFYLTDLNMAKLSLGYAMGADDRDLNDPSQRVRINRVYFWMPQNEEQLRRYWQRYEMEKVTTRQLEILRTNLPQALDPAFTAELEEVDAALDGLFAVLDGLPDETRVNLVIPPAHLGYWAHPAVTIVQGLHVRDRIAAYAQAHERVHLFDYAYDWERTTARETFYDAGHFTDLDMTAMRAEIAAGDERPGGDYRDIFRRFLSEPATFDADQALRVRVEN